MTLADPATVGVASRGLASVDVRPYLGNAVEIVLDPTIDDLDRLDAAIASAHLRLDAAALRRCPRLAVVTHVGSALHVDVTEATRLAIPILHNPGHNADSVAEHAIGLLLAVVKRIPHSDGAVRRRDEWHVGAPSLVTNELRGRTLGVLGFGPIGRRVAEIAQRGLGMQVAVWSRTAGRARSAGFAEHTLRTVLASSDAVSVHVAARPETTRLLDREHLLLLREGAWLINTSPASLLDLVALHDLLRSRHLAGAALDTWPGHRPDPKSPLLDLPNVVFTQHNAGLTHESIARMAKSTAQGLLDALAGRAPSTSTLVNPEVWPRRRSVRLSP